MTHMQMIGLYNRSDDYMLLRNDDGNLLKVRWSSSCDIRVDVGLKLRMMGLHVRGDVGWVLSWGMIGSRA